MLNERKAEILRALVEEYIQTGEPVSSKAVLDLSALNVSSATIRNDLASLESEGFVAQPHKSAGRAPTAKGYRYYVDHCMPTRLRVQTRRRVQSFFSSFHQGLSDLLKSTTELLSDITHYPAIVVGPGVAMERVRGVHVVPLAPQVLLLVLISNRGRVTQELVRLEEPVDPVDVTAAERTLGAMFERESVDEALAEGTKMSMNLPAPVAAVVREVMGAVGRIERGTREVYVSGTSQMTDVWEDLAAVRSILELLEREAIVLSILSKTPEGTGIQIGDELDIGDDMNLSVVSTTFKLGETGGGSVGVFGPMRMDYRRAISAVEEVGEILEESLGSS
ncbi:MAG TPA: heat-inducible transcriptional repressor HrcA [Acidimicrobiia bacterium]|nr:heat-inducible transcriptional repressor HrcA [Acidimicrobiia bacterium]